MTNVNPVARAEGLLTTHALLSDMPADVPALLLQGATVRRAAAGSTLFHEGDTASHYLLVLDGGVEMVRYGLEGEERVFNVFGSGQLVAETAMFMPHGRYPMNARAQSPLVACWLTRAALRHACETCPPLAMRMLESLSQRVYRRVNEVDWLIGSSAPQRLAAYLLSLQREQGDSLHLPINQRQLAARLGIRAETLSRLLSEWLARGYVRGRQRAWEVCDIVPLRELASAASRTF